MAKTYTTKLGDTWDVISLNAYGSELFVQELVEANPFHAAVAVFSSGVTLALPVVSAMQRDNINLPPWRRGQTAPERPNRIAEMVNDFLSGDVPPILPSYVNRWADRIYQAARLGD